MVTFLLSALFFTGAADKAPVFTDPAKAGIDYALQGEYAGELKDGDGNPVKIGVQVIAEGKGAFSFKAYHGGLPGAGHDGEAPRPGTAKLVQGSEKADIDFPGVEAAITPEAIVITKGGFSGKLPKVKRESSTLGAKAPEGATILFDGKSADEWTPANLTKDGLLGVGVTSKKKFNDFKAHIEFRTPFMPESRGQQRGNSGVYIQNRYELQVLDSFGLTGEDNECGGIYQQAKPAVNMALPPLSWQTYDIEFKAAKFDESGKKTSDAILTVTHNGTVIHDKLVLKMQTPGGEGKETALPGPFHFQNHGDQVVYRNVWVVETK